MARTTRSAAAHEKIPSEKAVDPAPSKTAMVARKRKRMSAGDSEAPLTKHPRSDDDDETVPDGTVKDDMEDGEEDAQELHGSLARKDSFAPAGDLCVRDEDATKILEVLEMMDTQGLMDRVFPLPDDSYHPSSPSPSYSSKSRGDSVSLRVMLQEPQEYPLRALRSAVSQLYPISSQPRSKTSQTAEQQLRFCHMALSLIEQASGHSLHDGPQDVLELIFPRMQSNEASSSKSAPVERRHKYALMQTLPSGEWWSSLNTDSLTADGLSISELGTGNADLVSILPAPSAAAMRVSTLGDLKLHRKQEGKMKPPAPRRMKGGYFLDYGPFASFAPTFDSEGAEVGRVGLGASLWRNFEKVKAREKAAILRKRMEMKIQNNSVNHTMDIEEVGTLYEGEEENGRGRERELRSSLLDTSGADIVEIVMDGLELEERVSELLSRNTKLLLRLEELQVQRLGGENGGSSTVTGGSEEWDTAQQLKASFELLVALRPRLSSKSSSAIIPKAATLRALHKTLPFQPTQGWYGTLADGRGTTLRDDNTIYMPTAPTLAATPSTILTVPAPVSTPTPQYAQQPSYGRQNYQYSSYPQSYPAHTSQGQPSSYYASPSNSNTNANGRQQPTGTPQYGGQQHSQYTWQPNFPSYMGSGTSSGRGTPQPQTSNSYQAYAGTAVAPPLAPLPSRAVANTVASSAKQPNGWSTPGTPYATLPQHMRGPAAPAVGSPLAGYGQNFGTSPVH